MSNLNENDFSPLEPQPFVTEEGREVERLSAELAAMRQQRDEARMDLCYAEAVARCEIGHEVPCPEAIAAERGWDCFAQKEGGGA